MDVASLTAFLAPLLPALLKIGSRAAGEVVDAAGEEAVSFARKLWDKLRGKVEAKPAAEEAANDVAANPEDEDLQAALRVQLKKLLEEDPDLLAELSKLWDEGQAANITNVRVTASGAGSVAVGGNVAGSNITTTSLASPGQ